jgi:WD40 repeat protein
MSTARKWLIAGGCLWLAIVAGLIVAVILVLGNPQMQAGRSIADTGRFWTSMDISPDWHTIALGGLYDGLQVWDMDTGQLKYKLAAGRVEPVKFSPDGQTVAFFWKSADEKKYQIEIHQTSDGKRLRTLSSYEYTNGLSFNKEGNILAATGDNSVSLWNANTGGLIKKVSSEEPYDGAISPDGKTMAIGGNGIQVIDVDSNQIRYSMPGWYHVAFSPDGKVLATASDINNETVQLWDMASGKAIRTLNPTGVNNAPKFGQIHSLSFSPDGSKLAAGTNEYEVYLWDESSGQLLRTIELGQNNPGEAVAFAPDNKTLAVMTSYKVTIWDVSK